MGAKILTRELEERVRLVEEKLAEIAERLERIDQQIQRNQPSARTHDVLPASNGHASNGIGSIQQAYTGDGKFAEMEAQIQLLDDRIQKIASTIVAVVAPLK
jgi:prefoldin subunit 5